MDVNKIKWRTVDKTEYDHAPFREGRRMTAIDGFGTMYELGTPAVEIPVDVGALIAPPRGEFKWLGYNPYVLSNDGSWYELQEGSSPHQTDDEEIDDYLNEHGWIVAFEGIKG